MTVLFVLAAFSIILASLFLLAFIWSVKSGQYDDDHTPGMRILLDDVSQTRQRKSAKNLKNPILLENNPLTAD